MRIPALGGSLTLGAQALPLAAAARAQWPRGPEVLNKTGTSESKQKLGSHGAELSSDSTPQAAPPEGTTLVLVPANSLEHAIGQPLVTGFVPSRRRT